MLDSSLRRSSGDDNVGRGGVVSSTEAPRAPLACPSFKYLLGSIPFGLCDRNADADGINMTKATNVMTNIISEARWRLIMMDAVKRARCCVSRKKVNRELDCCGSNEYLFKHYGLSIVSEPQLLLCTDGKCRGVAEGDDVHDLDDTVVSKPSPMIRELEPREHVLEPLLTAA